MLSISKEDCGVFMFYVGGLLSSGLVGGFKFMMDCLVDSCRKALLEGVVVRCSVCRSGDLVKNGRSKRSFGSAVQNYLCKNCGRFTCENYFHEFYRRKYPVPVILLALHQRMEGNPVSKVVGACAVPFLNCALRPCYSTVTRWILCYGSKLVDRVSRIKLKAGSREHWEIDEQYDSRIVPAPTKKNSLKIEFSDDITCTITINNKQTGDKINHAPEPHIKFIQILPKNNKYVSNGKKQAGTIGIIDPHTKIISLQTTTYNLKQDASSLIRKTMYKWQTKPRSVWSDGWTGYPLIMEALDISHGTVIHKKEWKSSKGHHDNNIEREWSAKREWMKRCRGFKNIQHRALYDKLYEIQRNFFTPRQALNGQTPAEKAGHPPTTLLELLKPTQTIIH